MKRIIKLLLTASLSVCPLLSEASSDGVLEIEMQIEKPSGAIVRTPIDVPFSCFLNSDVGMLYFTASTSAIYTADVSVINTNTGEEINDTICFSLCPSYLFLPSHGYYVVQVSLYGGEQYQGVFNY